MQVEITDVSQSYPLNGAPTKNYLVIQLPNGTRFMAEVESEDVIKAVIEASTQNGQQAAPARVGATAMPVPASLQQGPRELIHPEFPAEVQQEVPMVEVEQTDDPIAGAFAGAASESEKLDWRRLPPNALSPLMKSAFEEMGMPDMMTAEEIDFYVEKVMEGMREPDSEPEPAGQVQPPKAKATVRQGSTLVRQVPPIRTVQKDEMGNPIVAARHGEVDPGEVVGGDDMDEDGVGSI